MTMAPPTPSMPATKAPANPSDVRVRANGTVTRAELLQARVVGGEVGQRLVGDRLERGLHLRHRFVTGAPPVGLEQDQLVAQVHGRLAGDAGNELGRVALPLGPVAG